MAALPKTHRRVVLVRRPPGEPAEIDFRVEEVPVPEPRHGEVLVKVAYLSLDPYQRGRMRDAASYAANCRPGRGDDRRHGRRGRGLAPSGLQGRRHRRGSAWAGRNMRSAAGPALRKVDPSLAPISTANGVLGMPGMTAYFGLLEVGQPKPGETVVVSAASGAVGQVVGQIGKIMGCRVVGIAGGPKKCAFVKDELGFDACLDYKAEKDLDAALRAACPNGIDVYFDNVGGEISDAVLRNSTSSPAWRCAARSRSTTPRQSPMGPRLLGTFVGKRVSMRGFIVTDFVERYAPALRQMGEWMKSGKIKYREDVVEGIDKAPRAFIGMLRGENFGKLLVKMA